MKNKNTLYTQNPFFFFSLKLFVSPGWLQKRGNHRMQPVHLCDNLAAEWQRFVCYILHVIIDTKADFRFSSPFSSPPLTCGPSHTHSLKWSQLLVREKNNEPEVRPCSPLHPLEPLMGPGVASECEAWRAKGGSGGSKQPFLP